MKRFHLFLFVTFGFVFLNSCGDDTAEEKLKEPVADSFSKYLATDPNVAVFGKFNPKELITKTNYKNEIKSLVTAMVATYESQIEALIDTKEPAYFAANGPFETGGPNSICVFAKGKSKADFVKTVEKDMARKTKEVDGMLIAESDDFHLAYKDMLVILLVSPNEKNVVETFKKMYKARDAKKSGGKVDEILAMKGDIVLGADLEGLLSTSNTSIKSLPEAKQKEIAEMSKDSYTGVSCQFNNGELRIDVRNMFSPQLSQNMFLKPADPNLINEFNFGIGKAAIGLAINSDVTKMNRLMSSYFPGAMDDILTDASGVDASSVGGASFLIQMLDGKAGLMMAPDLVNFGITANAFIGANSIASGFGSQILEQKIKEQMFPSMSSEVYSTDNGVHINISWITEGVDKNSRLALPESAKNFGKKPFTAFTDLQGLPIEELLSSDNQWLGQISWIYVEGDNDGISFTLKAKDQTKNILQIALREVFSQLTGSISM